MNVGGNCFTLVSKTDILHNRHSMTYVRNILKLILKHAEISDFLLAHLVTKTSMD